LHLKGNKMKVIEKIAKRKAPPRSLAGWGSEVIKMPPAERIGMIRTGVEASYVIFVSKHFGIAQTHIAQLLGTSEATLIRKLKAKAKLGPMESERLARIAMIEAEAEQVFGDADMAKQWMTSDNIALGEAPLSLLDTDTGAHEVRKVLASIAYGLAA
jgi:putative toxin-antitoxin system antitoxin component (TIGR02293 family)